MTKTIEEVIGENIRTRREKWGLSQAEFGKEVERYFGAPWKSQTVSAAEKGRRQFIAAELVVVAHVLKCRVQDLMTVSPPQDVQITDSFVRPADYSGPLEETLDRAPIDLSSWLEPFSTSYRELLRAQGNAKEVLGAVSDLSDQLGLVEQLFSGFVAGDEVQGNEAYGNDFVDEVVTGEEIQAKIARTERGGKGDA